MPLKDVEEWIVCFEQNGMFVDRREERIGGPKFRFFADGINE